jgi:hypothetical protein
MPATPAPPTANGTTAATTDPNASSSAASANGESDQLRPAQILLAHLLDVGVEGGSARHQQVDVGWPRQGGLELGDEALRFFGWQVEADQRVGGVAVGGDQTRIVARQDDVGDEREVGHLGEGGPNAPGERWIGSGEALGTEDDHHRRRSEAELPLEHGAGPGRLRLRRREPPDLQRFGDAADERGRRDQE